MNFLGIIVEYNPFHNGHLYHLEESKKKTNADYVVAVMSGNFTQRGEPAIFDKWTRTKMALTMGVDLVLELPTLFAVNNAEIFAFGAIHLLNSLGLIDCVVFGSEIGDIDILHKIADVLVNEPDQYKFLLKSELKKGYTYPKAVSNSLKKYLNITQEKQEILTPNNILSIEYLKTLKKIKSPIIPYTIKRFKVGYHDTAIKGNIASATAIRQYIKNENALFFNVIPLEIAQIIEEEKKLGKGPIFIEDFEKIIIYKLKTSSKKELTNFLDINEGLENRIIEVLCNSASLNEVMLGIKTKRYTLSRIRRFLIHLMLGITRDDIYFYKELGPLYLRVLGFNQKGREILKKIKKHCSLPIITKISETNKLESTSKKLLDMDILAEKIYGIAYPDPRWRKSSLLYREPIIF